MLLLIDIGNTNTKIGFYEDGFKRILNFKTGSKVIPVKDFTHNKKIDGAVICSVVPSLTKSLAEVIRKRFKINPLIVSHKIRSGLRYRIKNPETLGADRIATAVGARMLYKGNIIIVNFGTATTFSLINKDNEYLGGAIMPGVEISADVLAQRTALLPRIELKEPEKMIGKDTEENILIGIIIGHAGGVERIIREMKKESGLDAKVIATGGMADIITPFIKSINTVNPLLCLEGLRFLYELNLN